MTLQRRLPGGWSVGGRSARGLRERPTRAFRAVLPLDDPRNIYSAPVPFVRFFTEPAGGKEPSPVYRSETDYPLVRTYQMAGGAHVDQPMWDIGEANQALDQLNIDAANAGCSVTV